MTEPWTGSNPLRDVREGMRVVDSTGSDVGTVREVRMADPQAVTTAGQGLGETQGGDVDIANMFDRDSALPEQEQARLAREGYLRVDTGGIFSGDRYVAAEEVGSVSGDAVHLTVPSDRLLG